MMMTLPFTEKKFKSLSVKGQHKWSIKWLSGIYHGLVTNRIPPKNFDFILTSYQTLLKWQNIAPLDPYKPKYMDPMEFIELISDAIHFHRRAQGLVPRDTDLLPRVNRMDTNPATAMDGKKKPESLNYHMALDGIRSLFNTGSMFRICDAGGFSSLIIGSAYEIDNPATLKTSMGAHKWVPHEITHDLAGRLEEMKTRGYSIIGIETIEGSKNYASYDWPGKAIIVLGNEEYGISSHVLRVCDDYVHIPMSGIKNSINVACAASVIVFHIASQKKYHNIY